MAKNKCKRCGSCCRNLIIEISQLDVVREPRLLKVAKLMNVDLEYESDWDKEYLLACGKTMPCPFLKNNLCEIYPTRPNVCVAMEPGGEQCKMVRAVQ